MGSTKRKTILWSLWLAVVPVGLYIVYQTFPPPNVLSWEFATFVMLALLSSVLPFTINGTPVFLVQWVTIAVFLKYGLFIEIILSQLTVLALLFSSRSRVPRSLRFPFNSFMFFSVSLIAGLTFYAVGGETGSLNVGEIVMYGLVYQLIYIITNHLFLYVDDLLSGFNKPFLSIDTIWDFSITLLVFPYAIVLYFSQAYIGIPALFLLGVPFMMVTILLRMYNSSEKINIDLKKAGIIGHQLADRLTSEEVIDQFVVQVTDMFKVDAAYVIDYRDGQLVVLRIYENGQFQYYDVPPIKFNQGIAGKVVMSNSAVIYDKQDQWKAIAVNNFPCSIESIMATPVSRNNKIEGVLLLGSKRKFAFVNHQLQILEILSTYFAVSLEKAGYMEKVIAKSERCGLTHLYNYRFLDEALEGCMSEVKSGELENLSLIMMDIDHFKGLNDRYGHQSGNDVLIRLAKILTEEVGEEGTVARYGGEEFVVLLPNYSKAPSMLLAEKIRKRVEGEKFLIDSDLDVNRETQAVQITVSIGVSTAPEDSDDGMALIRNADRALYIGAKEKGRNKVAAYSK
ncbi:MAG TPA: diguanylate cyclase [Planococcus sp. (in: firmicutes)]|nr:diguanylate cyclase [Planococcus sp. (in: firmicutes)]